MSAAFPKPEPTPHPVTLALQALADAWQEHITRERRESFRLVKPALEELLSIPEAAKVAGISERSIERLIRTKEGRACVRRFGRRVKVERSGLMALARRG